MIKFLIPVVVGFVFESALSGQVFAVSQGKFHLNDQSLECLQIENACGEAGFTQGTSSHSGRDLINGCVWPILQGHHVARVSVNPDVVKWCQAQQQKSNSSKKPPQT